MTKYIAIAALALSTLLLTGCVSVSSLLAIAAKEIQNAANLPNITPIEKTWLLAASTGTECAANVLKKGEAAAQETVDIAACFVSLPFIPASDQTYIQFAIDALDAFIILYEPLPVAPAPASAAKLAARAAYVESPVALKSNADVRAGKNLTQFTAAMSKIAVASHMVQVQLGGAR